MNDEQALRRAMQDDWRVSQILADWLEEHERYDEANKLRSMQVVRTVDGPVRITAVEFVRNHGPIDVTPVFALLVGHRPVLGGTLDWSQRMAFRFQDRHDQSLPELTVPEGQSFEIVVENTAVAVDVTVTGYGNIVVQAGGP